MNPSTTSTPIDFTALLTERALAISRLPLDIQELLDDPGFELDIYEIADAHKVDSDLQFRIISITQDLLMGGIKPQEYVAKLTERLEMPREKVALIARDINTKVFHDVKDSLLTVHGLLQKPESAPVATTTAIAQPGTANTNASAPVQAQVIPTSTLDQKLGGGFISPAI